MKYADKLEIPYVIVIGDDEIANNTVKVKNMETGEEKSTDFNAESVKKVIKGE
jgi:histidyl-tRNA synthetase